MHIVYLEEFISDIEKRIDEILINYKEEVELLITMPGIKKDTAAVIIAEVGVDMTQFYKMVRLWNKKILHFNLIKLFYKHRDCILNLQ